MDRGRDNLWTRRTNKNSLSSSENDHNESSRNDQPTSRAFPSSKRFGGAEGSRNPFNAISPLSTSGISSPTSGASASSAFGLGSGAFASFGSSGKTPKTTGTTHDFSKVTKASPVPPTPSENRDKGVSRIDFAAKRSTTASIDEDASSSNRPSSDLGSPWPLKYTWVIWYRPPTSKNSDYEKSTKPMCKMSTAQQFWCVYTHLKRPSTLPTVSDYHFFREGIRPVWEDDENKKGGKWIMRLKKGVSDRYWEDLLMAMIGDQFADAADEVSGAVLSVRPSEDVFSIWTKLDGGKNVKIRETIKRVLALPPETNIVWKSHDDSIAQRMSIDQARQEKASQHSVEKRRATLSNEEGTPLKEKGNDS